ncbi:MAG: ATP-binding protein [Chloroflexi bacterium]|nr:ATP-binding protein [Chloroflexota bacterium]
MASELAGGNELVGREGIVADICWRLSGRSVLLAAPRRVGKTSVAREVLRRLEKDGYLTASLDFFRLTSQRDCAERLIKQLLESSHSLRTRVRRFGRAVGTLAGNVQPFWRVAEMEFGINLGSKDEDENRLFQQALELPETLAKREKRKVVVLMDEFQEADRSLGPQVYRIMRSYFQEQPNTHQLFAGSRASLLRKLFTSPKAALLRYAVEAPLPWPGPEDWVPYIRRKFRGARLDCSQALAEDLVQTTGGHPADTMEVCLQLHIAAHQLHATTLTPDLLRAGVDRAEQALKPVFDEIWDDLRDTRYARRLAQRIVEGLPPRSRELPSSVSGDAIDALLDKGVILREGRGYRFPEPLFERYVRRMLE